MSLQDNLKLEAEFIESIKAEETAMETIGYVGKTLGDGMGVERHGSTSRRELTDWHGNVIGTCFLSSSWPVRSYIGSRMYQIYARINGVDYTGRGFGEGMAVNLKRCAKQA